MKVLPSHAHFIFRFLIRNNAMSDKLNQNPLTHSVCPESVLEFVIGVGLIVIASD